MANSAKSSIDMEENVNHIIALLIFVNAAVSFSSGRCLVCIGLLTWKPIKGN